MPTVDQYRRDLDELVRLANVDLEVLWRQVDDAVVARELLADILPELTAVYGSAAGTLAADWYDELRAENEIRGRFSAIVAELPPRDVTDSLAGWAVSPLFAAEPAVGLALDNAQSGLQKVIADVGRNTITESTIFDPGARGWMRQTTGGCGFCQMIASRGAVYSERSVNFGSHRNCRCVAVPAFGGRPNPVEAYTPTTREVTDADRRRTREWMRENGYID